MGADELARQVEAVGRAGELEDVAEAEAEDVGLVSVAREVGRLDVRPVEEVFARKILRTPALGGAEAAGVLQRLKAPVDRDDAVVAGGAQERDRAEAHVAAADDGDGIAREGGHHLRRGAHDAGERLHDGVLVGEAVRHAARLGLLHDDELLVAPAAETGHAIADAETRHARPDGRDDADGLVAEDVALLRGAPRIPLRVAHAGERHLDEELRAGDLRDGNVDDPAFARTFHDELFHAFSSVFVHAAAGRPEVT